MDFTVTTVGSNKFCVPKSSSHRPAAQAILNGKVWEEDTLALIKDELLKYSVGDIIHAGTYFGDFLPNLGRLVRSGAKIWAFEPSEENYLCAKITIMLNDLKNVNLFHAGLGAVYGVSHELVTETNDGRALGGGSYIRRHDQLDDGRKSEQTPITRIDCEVPKDRIVSIIHLDVEGYEEFALHGALDTIDRCHPLLILETPPNPCGVVWSVLKATGYKIDGTVDGNTILKCR